MGKTRSRVAGICLSLTVALLGAGTTVLLYYAGQEGIELLYDQNTYIDDQGRINRRLPMDDWYGSLIMRAWAFGFIYIVPGLLGIAAFLFFNKCMLGCVGVLDVICLIVGSFMYSCGATSIIIYRYFFLNNNPRNNPWLGDCIFVTDNTIDLVEYVDQRCMTGRRLLMICIAACGVSFLAWGMLLATLIYNSCIFHSVVKEKSKAATKTPSLPGTSSCGKALQRALQRSPGPIPKNLDPLHLPTTSNNQETISSAVALLHVVLHDANTHHSEDETCGNKIPEDNCPQVISGQANPSLHHADDTDDEPGTLSRVKALQRSPGPIPNDLDHLHLPTTSNNQETISSAVALLHVVLHDADTHHSEDETCGNKVPEDNCPQVISGQDNPSFHHADDTDDGPGTSSLGKAQQSSTGLIPEDINSLHLPTTSNNQETISSAVAPLYVVLHDADTHHSEDETCGNKVPEANSPQVISGQDNPSFHHADDTDEEPGTSSRGKALQSSPGPIPEYFDSFHLPTTSNNQETISSAVALLHVVLHDADTHHSDDETCGNKVPEDNCPQVISGQDNPSFHHADDTDDGPGTASRGKAQQSSPGPIPNDLDPLHLLTTSNNQETISSAVAPLHDVLDDADVDDLYDDFLTWGI